MYDQGEYICVAENSVGRIDAAANIVVVPDPNNRRFEFIWFPEQYSCQILLQEEFCWHLKAHIIQSITISEEGEEEEAGIGRAIFHQGK